jgi:biotin-[acetyl-CoA-carboxylase] ligase BirA-like protein
MFDILAFDTPRFTELSERLSAETQLHVHVLPQVDSTNRLLLAHGENLPLQPKSPLACIALQQHQGRGRLGRSWISSHNPSNTRQNTAFMASVGLSTHLPLSQLTILSLQVGVAVAQYLQGLGLDIALKWPNDLVLRTHNIETTEKIGGILIETRNLDSDKTNHLDTTAVVIGLGLNWYAAPQIANRMTACVADNLPAYALPDAESACIGLLNAMHLAWKRTEQQQHCEFAPFDILAGQTVTLHPTTTHHWSNSKPIVQAPIVGIAHGVNAQGCLGIYTHQGLRWFHSGEISFNPPITDSIDL